MLSVIKEVVKQTVEAEKPANFTVGTVLSAEPVKIQVTDKLVLGKNQIVVSERLTDRFVYMTAVENGFEDIKDKEKYEIRRKYALYDGLKVGETVILARAAGGQTYFVIDRVGVLE